jgi:hypothetical protein
MKVDRERFLVLATTLAAGVAVGPGCNSGQSPPADDPHAAYAANAQALGASAGGPPAAGPTVGPTAGPATTGDIVQIPPQPGPPLPTATSRPVATATATAAPIPTPIPTPVPAPTPAPTPTPTASPTASPVAPSYKGANPYDGTPIAAQSCSAAENAVGTPGRCALKAPGPTCESFGDTVKECPTMTSLLKPKVAQAAIDCLNRKSGTKDICEFNVTSICAYEALASACLDPAARTLCNGVMARCGAGPRGNYNKMTRDACEAGVSGIADARRKKFVSCITEFCRFEVCLTYL